MTLKDIEGQLFGLVVLRDDGGNGFEVIEERSHGPDPLVVTFDHRPPRQALRAGASRRAGSAPIRCPVVHRAAGNQCLLPVFERHRTRRPCARRGCPADLLRRVLNGFSGSESGSDDIQINVGVNGVNAAHIPHTDDLAFDDDTRRDIVMPTIAYTSEAKFELVELDDFSAADRASVQIPKLPAAVTAAQQIITRDGPAIRGIYPIKFDSDDGHYELEITVSSEPPMD